MKRRDFLFSMTAAPAAFNFAVCGLAAEQSAGSDLDNPYRDIDWDTCDFVHSMSHQHQGQSDASRDDFRKMGYRHFAFSNYYPSNPTPLPADYRARHPEIIAAPNAEQHSFPDAGLHFNGIGSLLATGYGKWLGAKEFQACPLIHRFENLNVFEDGPARGVYRLDVTLENVGNPETAPTASLTIRGATGCAHRKQFADLGPVENRPLKVGRHSIYLRTTASELETELQYDNVQLKVTQFRLMQGTNRPWREMFRAALDGEMIDGHREGGLLYPDGGGITLNHPTSSITQYIPMLDFDPRVLGIEIWNQHHGFGFGTPAGGDVNLHYYRLWDDLLRTGRRCWGFFVKDHLTHGRGRNVLIVPSAPGSPLEEREAAALRAYRNGTFFGSVASLAVNKYGDVTSPYDYSEFRFRRIAVRRDTVGKAVMLEVEVTGNDREKRPAVQIRIVTDQGTALVVDGTRAEFPLKRDADGRLEPSFVRVEAIAYPRTCGRGQPLTADIIRKLNVHEISQINDQTPLSAPALPGDKQELIPTVDLIFSQPLLRV